MKEYLQLFRGSAFSGAMALFKRILLPNLLMNLILAILTGAVVFPLLLAGLGWELSDVLNIQEKMKEMAGSIQPGSNPMDAFGQMFGNINFAFIFLAVIVMILFSAYKNVALYKLNDNEVRNSNSNFLDALKGGISENVFSMIGLSFAVGLLVIVIFLVYMLIVYLLYSMASFIGIIFGFILFFFMAIFIIRFMISSPALVHGNMGVFEAINYSFKSITWKRAGLLFLMGLVVIVISLIVGGVLGLITNAIGLTGTGVSIPLMIANQILQTIVNSIISAFFFAAVSAIYFRYSEDSDGEEQNIEEHFIS